MGGFAWVTLATNDSYSLGALVLAHSLKAVGTAQQLAVLVTPGVTSAMREKLSAVFNLVQEVNVLDSRDENNLRLLKRPELGITFTKLHCWRLTQYDKCVFLDADTLVLQFCDELFEREELSAAPDVGWPDCFNSGVFVYRPSLETYDKLIQFALEKGSFDGGDQGLLNLYFSDWAHKDISRHLPFIYNMCSTACYSYLPAFKQFGANAKIIHFIGAQKPWLQYFNTESRKVQPSADSSHLQEVLQRWWDIFCSLIHPQLSPAMAGLAGALAQLTLGVPRTPEQDALENVLRKQAWEVGNIDYLGKDSFENIWSKISETLDAALEAATSQPVALASESEPSAPAQSQTDSAPQEEAKPVQPAFTPVDTSTDPTTSMDSLKIDSESGTPIEPSNDLQASSEPAVSPKAETIGLEKPEPQVITTSEAVSSTTSKEVKEESILSQPLSEASATPNEKVSDAEPAVCLIPTKQGDIEAETKALEPQVEVPQAETKASEPVTDDIAVEIKASEPLTAAPVTETKPTEPLIASVTDAKPTIPPTAAPVTETKPTEPPIASVTGAKLTKPSTAVPVTETKSTEPVTAAAVTETKPTEVQTGIPVTETSPMEPKTAVPPENATETSAAVPVTETKPTEPQAAVPATETKATEPHLDVTKETEVCPIPQKTKSEHQVAESELPKDTGTAEELVCPLSEKKKLQKKSEAQIGAPQLEQKEPQEPSLQLDASKETHEKPKVTSQEQEKPKATPQVQETPKEPSIATVKELKSTSQPQQPEASPEKPEVSATPITDSKKGLKSAPKEVPGAAKSTDLKDTTKDAKSTALKDTTKVTASKESQKTEVTAATPPTTPGSPLVEKTKESLAAEASVPDTPPPSEGGSTPTPPPRKTDKPKKVAAKSKK